jgi:hypothetical protein
LTNKETGLDAMAGDGGYQEGTLADAIRMRMRREGKRFWAGGPNFFICFSFEAFNLFI